MKPIVILSTSLWLLGLVSCNTPAPTPSSETSSEPLISESSSEPVDDGTVSVFVLSGQSNMEGSTFYDNGHDYLRNVMNDQGLDPEPCFDGIEGVQTSFYGYYPYTWGSEPTPHCSNPEDPMAGKFMATKVGMGNDDRLMGPELTCAYTLKDHRKNDKPIFFIKCAFSGSGFEGWQHPCWKSRSQGVEGELYDKLVTYTNNNLKLIEDAGYKPVIKGLLWHQGESDTNNNDQASKYHDNLATLLSDFREDFKDYAKDQDGENINFIDALIYDGTVISYAGVEVLNEAKIALSKESEHNFCINTSTKREGGLNLVIGGGADNSDVDGCYNKYHYITKDMVRLGQAYAQVILDNNMLD